MTSAPDLPDNALADALLFLAGGADAATLVAAECESWQRATFRGHRHRLTLRVNDAGAAAIARTVRAVVDIAPNMLHLPGQLVADMCIASVLSGPRGQAELVIDALTVEHD